MVYETIDRGRRGHLVAKDPVPLTEHQIARHHDRAAFVPFGEERKELWAWGRAGGSENRRSVNLGTPLMLPIVLRRFDEDLACRFSRCSLP